MSPIFIGLDDGSYLNLDEVESYEEEAAEEFIVRGKNGKEYCAWPSPERAIVQIIPCNTPMHKVRVFDPGEDRACEITWEPVIAWGLTITGEVVPVTPTQASGPDDTDFWGSWGLRQPDTEEIMVPFDGTYANEAEWAAAWKRYQAERRKAAREKKKVKRAKKAAVAAG